MARNDQRRRRVVIDGALHDDDSSESRVPIESVSRRRNSASEAPADAYARRASRTFQLRTTDFIPKRPWAVTLLIVAVLTVIGLVNAGYFLTQNAPAEVAQRFALVGTGTLSAWCSSLLMLACCLASLQIYAIRQHRQDDYQGTYRVWLLFAGVLLLASLHCVIDVGGLMAMLWSGETRPAVNSFLGSGVTMLAIGGIFFRGLVEVRASKGTLTLVCTAWVIYVLAVVMQFPQVESKLVEVGLERTEVVFGNTLWIGHSLLFMALVVYARNLFLTSNGLMALAAPRRKKKKSVATASKAKGSKSTTTKKRPSKSSGKKTQTSEALEELDETEDSDVEGDDKESVSQSAESKPQTLLGRTIPETKRSAPSTSGGPLSSKLKGRQAVATQSDEEDDDEAESPENMRLSKSERRKMRKQQAATRRAA